MDMSDKLLRLLILGAHPDDAEFHAGGLASIYREGGHAVKFVSVTDGGAGHHQHASDELVKIRRAEAAASARVIGATSEVWGNPDGSLQPTLDVRQQIIREIRSFAPDLVLTHRTCDYHPDHRAVGQAVQDASYMVTVPLVAPDVPPLAKDPVVAYMPDLFTRPCPLRPDVVLDISDHVESIVAMLACHYSQVFEFLPHNHRVADLVPDNDDERIEWLRGWYLQRLAKRADRFRGELVKVFGEERGRRLQCVEIYEISEYAAQPDAESRSRLFPVLPTM